MRHDRYGYWIEEAGIPDRRPPLSGEVTADVVIVGGGFLGMWAAWHHTLLAPEASVVLLEADCCGCGPSGRNGGFVDHMWTRAPQVAATHGREAALALGEASSAAVRGIGDWCRENAVDASYRQAPKVEVATTPGQDRIWDDTLAGLAELGIEDKLVPLSAAEIAERCRSPFFRGGVVAPENAWVQPARLSFGMRRVLIDRGVQIFEGSPVTRIERIGAVKAHTAGGSVTAAAGILAVNSATGSFEPFGRHLSVASSHMVITEPVPDVLEEIGWTGDTVFNDGRAMVHYMSTTPDRRISFGWGGGTVAWGARRSRRLAVDADSVAHAARQLVEFFPPLAGRRITNAWGGPIDVSPTRLSQYRSVGSLHAGFGFTGHGVGPSFLGGQILSRLALDRRDELTRLPLVEPEVRRFPPEPLRFAGGSVFRRALMSRDAREQEGRRPNPAIDLVASVPRRIGMNLPR